MLSSEEIDLINVSNLTEKQEEKLRETVTRLIEFKKKKKKGVLKHIKAENDKLSKKNTKDTYFGENLDQLYSCDTFENYEIFKSISK